MKKKAITVSIIASIVIFGSSYLLFCLQGRNYAVNKLKRLAKRDVSIGSLSYIPPFKFLIKKLEISGVFKAERILVRPSLLSLFSGKWYLNEIKIINPELTYEKTGKNNPAVLTEPSVVFQKAVAQPEREIKKENLKFVFKRLNISGGKIILYDHTIGTSAIKLTVKDVAVSLTNARNAQSVTSNFDIKGNIPWDEGKQEGSFTARGWVDLFKKDINAHLKIEGIDGVYLYPYYSSWLNVPKANIEAAKLNFVSAIRGVDNNVSAECHLELSDMIFKQNPDEENRKKEKMMKFVMDRFKDLDGQRTVFVNFTYKTKLDNPQFGFQIIKGALEDKIAQIKKQGRPLAEDIVLFPAVFIGEALKGASEITKAVINGSFAFGNEFKKAVQASFRTGK